MYMKEAHPDDGRKTPKNEKDGIAFHQPKTEAERATVATECKTKLALSLPFVLDGLDNKVGEAYAAWPDRLYIVGKDGKIYFKGDPGPKGFKVSEMAGKLEELLKGEGKK